MCLGLVFRTLAVTDVSDFFDFFFKLIDKASLLNLTRLSKSRIEKRNVQNKYFNHISSGGI